MYFRMFVSGFRRRLRSFTQPERDPLERPSLLARSQKSVPKV